MENTTLVIGFIVLLVLVLGIVIFKLFQNLKMAKSLLHIANEEKLMLLQQIDRLNEDANINNRTISKQKEQIETLHKRISELDSIINAQGKKIKEYENFINVIKDAQNKKKTDSSSNKFEESNNTQKNDINWFKWGVRAVRLGILLTTGVPI